MVHASNPSSHEMETGESEVQDHPRLKSEFWARLGYLRSCLAGGKKPTHQLPQLHQWANEETTGMRIKEETIEIQQEEKWLQSQGVCGRLQRAKSAA